MQFLSRHPHIVSLRDVGEDRGRLFLVMDLVGGGTLAERIEGGGDRRELLELLVKVARAVHFAHEAGVLHRDLKPANVLLDERGQPLVTDFGLAKDLQEVERLTKTGDTVGTVHYMAPEQARPDKARPLDRRVDVYALGVILYVVLTGQPPFQGMAGWVISQIVSAPPTPPRKIDPSVDPELQRICLRALAKDPVERLPTAEAMAHELERTLGGEIERRRRPAVWIASLAGNLILIGALLAVLSAGGPPPAPEPPAPPAGAELTWPLAVRMVRAGAALSETELVDLGGTAPSLEALARLSAQSALLEGRSDRCLELLEPIPPGPARDLLEAEAHLARGDLESAATLLETGAAADLAWRADSPGERWAALARAFEERGRTEAAARFYVRAARAERGRARVGWLETAFGLDPATASAEGDELAGSLLQAAQQTLASASVDDESAARAISRARWRLSCFRLARPLESIPGQVLQDLRRLRRSPHESLGLCALPSVTHLDLGPNDLAAVYALLDRPLDVAELAALKVSDPRTWPPPWRRWLHLAMSARPALRVEILLDVVLWRPELSPAWYQLGLAEEERRRYAHALRHFEVTQQLEQESPRANHLLGKMLSHLGRPAEALPFLQRAVELDRRKGKEDEDHLYVLACVLHETGSSRRALEILESVRSAMKKESCYWSSLAEVHADLGDGEAAERCRAKLRKLTEPEPLQSMQARVKAKQLNVRSGPGLGYSRVTRIHRGERHEALARQAGWVLLRLPNDLEGWVLGQHVELEETSTEQ
jgi:tetratricopeptide (TPR) repeat protein